jgi:hypothetical protein
VYVYKIAMSASNVPAVPSLMRELTESGANARFGEAVVGFLTNEGNFSWFPKYHLAVGAPGRVYKDHAGGSVFLYDISEDGTVKEIAARGMPKKQEEADFGAALAVQGANCISGQCSRGNVHLAIGSPSAMTSGVFTGALYRWDPWSKTGDVNPNSDPALLESGTDKAQYGTALATLRTDEGGGGFVVGAPDLMVIKGLDRPAAGSAVVYLNEGYPNAWKSWMRILSKTTTGDRRPEN